MPIRFVLLAGSQLAVYTWHGCCVELRGSTVQEYDATNATMPHYFSVASIIEQRRKRATELGTAMCPPPKVLVCGSSASGKSTLAYMLANFALRKHRRPIFVELDPRCTGSFRELPHLPGTMNATILDSSCYEFDTEPTATYKISQPPKDLNSFEAVQSGGTMDQLSNRLGRSLWYHIPHQCEVPWTPMIGTSMAISIGRIIRKCISGGARCWRKP